VDSIWQARDQHERVTGVIYKIRFAEAPALQGSAARVDVIYDAPATRRYAESGQLLETEPAVTGYKTELRTDDVTHDYGDLGAMPTHVVVQWGGTFRVGGAPEQYAIRSPATVTGPMTVVTVLQSRAQLVAG